MQHRILMLIFHSDLRSYGFVTLIWNYFTVDCLHTRKQDVALQLQEDHSCPNSKGEYDPMSLE